MNNKEINNKSISSSPRKESEKKKETKENSFTKFSGMIVQFFRDAKMELKKVKWPTRKELLATTAMVLVLTIIVGIFLGLVDAGLIKLIQFSLK
ncbi:MAG: preprotein translocase subunit SecE [Desulfobacteraceae bacterium]|nr:MAG: preprotein translocase subunit SecE [Desulfobacteraceae bacterium]